VENLPTSGDLTWPGGTWNSGATSPTAGDEPTSPCQTWRPSELAGLTGSAGRVFDLQGPITGRGQAYVLSFAGDAEVTAAYEQLMTDGAGCATRLGGRASQRQDASAPWGSGEFVDVTLPGPAGDRTVSTGVGRVGTRLVWLAIEVDGTEVGVLDPQADPDNRHTMINSLPKAMQRLR
ncbi:MAG: hypothetical protein L0G99_09340, partial [Propionibacteriales bacterium]|nr:hypothetical protein [Propionibacteriales bacterium]